MCRLSEQIRSLLGGGYYFSLPTVRCVYLFKGCPLPTPIFAVAMFGGGRPYPCACAFIEIVYTSEVHSTENGTTPSKHLWKWVVVCIFQQRPFPMRAAPVSHPTAALDRQPPRPRQENPTSPLSAVPSRGCALCLLLQLALGKESSYSKPGSSGREGLEGKVDVAPSTTRTHNLGANTNGKSKIYRGVCCGWRAAVTW